MRYRTIWILVTGTGIRPHTKKNKARYPSIKISSKSIIRCIHNFCQHIFGTFQQITSFWCMYVCTVQVSTVHMVHWHSTFLHCKFCTVHMVYIFQYLFCTSTFSNICFAQYTGTFLYSTFLYILHITCLHYRSTFLHSSSCSVPFFFLQCIYFLHTFLLIILTNCKL